MRRASIALGVSVVLLALSSPQVPVHEAPGLVFSYRGAEEGYAPTSISQDPPTVTQTGTYQEAMLADVSTRLLLQEGALHVYLDGDLLWASDASWDVRGMLVADVNNDGEHEVALVLWKPFRREPDIFYDTFRFPSPWEEGSLRNHLFVYRLKNDEWLPLWCSSPIPDPISEMAVGDVDADGANELVVLEGRYGDSVDEPARHVSVWRWNGWGFALQWRSPAGVYDQLALWDADGDDVTDIVTY